jgi:hypothetical protein
MVTIRQTIDIPTDRQVSLKLPESVPSGKSNITLILTPEAVEEKPVAKESSGSAEDSKKKRPANPPLDRREALIAIAWKTGQTDDSSRKYAGCLKGKNVFKGDPVEIQRKMRNEW